jgi:NADH dehydrogenase FAD-containing subunit
MSVPRVVIVGAGCGGLAAARRLRRAPVEVVVIDRHNHHLFQPLLYQVATAILSPGEIAPRYAPSCAIRPTPRSCWARLTGSTPAGGP